MNSLLGATGENNDVIKVIYRSNSLAIVLVIWGGDDTGGRESRWGTKESPYVE